MKNIKQPLQQYLKRYGFHGHFKKENYQDIQDIWKRVVGKNISKHARPVALKEGRLYIDVSDGTWKHHLTMMKNNIINNFNKACEKEMVSEIVFKNVDFRSRSAQIKEGNYSGKSEVKKDWELKKIKLDETEKEEIIKATESSPPFLRENFKKLLENHYRQQKWKQQQGALKCQRCGVYCMPEEQHGGYCPCCSRIMEEWISPLKRIFHRHPWFSFEDISSRHPFLDYETYRGARERVLQDYAKRINDIWHSHTLTIEQKKKILLRLTQRYVLLFEGKRPDLVRETDVYRALQNFPGLYQFLYEKPIKQ